jgi:hypothetical protein
MIALHDAMNALQAEAASYSHGVRIWMRIMAASYFAGIFFAPWRREALLVVGKVLDPTLTRSVLGSVIHLILWPLTLFLLWSPEARNRRRTNYPHGLWYYAFRAWLIWVTSLIMISLVLDAKFLLSQAAGG